MPTRVVVAFIDSANNYTYKELAGAPASATAWSQYSSIFTVPSSAIKATVFHIIDSVGSLTIDDVSLSVYTSTIPTTGPVIFNPSLEIANGSVPANWVQGKWGTNSTVFSYVSEGHTGTKSVKVAVSNYSSGDAKWYFEPITTVQVGKQYRFSVWYKTNVSPKVVAMFIMADGSEKYFGMPVTLAGSNGATEWQQYSDTFIVPTGAVAASVFLFINQNGWVQTDDYSLTEYTPTGFNRPLLSLTFDDGHEDNVLTALPILNKYGLKTTQCYATTYIQGMTQDVIDGVKAFSSSGHEICSHSVTHPYMTAITNSQLTTELSSSQQYLRSSTGQQVSAFATPYGDYNSNVLTYTKQYYGLHRSVDEGFNSKDNLNPYNIRVQNILNTTTAAQVAAWIAQAKAENTWLVLVYHRVANDPGPYDSYINVFEQHIQTILSSGITVKTLTDAYNEVSVQ